MIPDEILLKKKNRRSRVCIGVFYRNAVFDQLSTSENGSREGWEMVKIVENYRKLSKNA
jgi:hypothetical protein